MRFSEHDREKDKEVTFPVFRPISYIGEEHILGAVTAIGHYGRQQRQGGGGTSGASLARSLGRRREND